MTAVCVVPSANVRRTVHIPALANVNASAPLPALLHVVASSPAPSGGVNVIVDAFVP